MPAIDGVEVLRSAREFADAKGIVLTACAEQAYRLVVISVATDSDFVKPLSLGEPSRGCGCGSTRRAVASALRRGIRLAIAMALVGVLDARILADRERPRRGATFRIVLPRAR